jgi:hypothetical protein
MYTKAEYGPEEWLELVRAEYLQHYKWEGHVSERCVTESWHGTTMDMIMKTHYAGYPYVLQQSISASKYMVPIFSDNFVVSMLMS